MEADTGSLVLFFVFLLLGALVVLCQNAAVEVSDSRLRRRAEEIPHAEQLQKLLKRPSRFSAAMRGGYTFFHLCAVVFLVRWAFSLPLAPESFWNVRYGVLLRGFLALLVGDFFILTFSRGIPRRIAAAWPEKLTKPWLIGFFLILFTPIAWLSEKTTGLVARLFGVQAGTVSDNVTEEEIRMMVDVSEETGGIEQAEKDMINNVFEFDDRTVNELMTHRTDIKFLELSATLEEAVALSTQFGFSRIPVTGEDGLDDILGLLYIKDLLPLILADRGKSFVLADYLRQPMFVPESTRCRDLFAQMSARKMQVAIVVDEYGGTSGLVTMEDLLESIVGNIQDEYDNEEADATPVGEDGYTFDGDIDLPEAERILGCILSPGSEEDYDTLGGLMIGLLDRIPGPDEHPSVELSGFRFTVQQANERQILRVLAEKIPGEKPE